jgi:hypothetical protein
VEIVVFYQKIQVCEGNIMPGSVLIFMCGRSRAGRYCCGYVNDSTPPCHGYYSFKPDTGKIYSLDDAVVILKEITAGHPDAVVIFKPI